MNDTRIDITDATVQDGDQILTTGAYGFLENRGHGGKQHWFGFVGVPSDVYLAAGQTYTLVLSDERSINFATTGLDDNTENSFAFSGDLG